MSNLPAELPFGNNHASGTGVMRVKYASVSRKMVG